MIKILQKICLLLATLGPVGYWKAPGTCATAATCLVIFCIDLFIGPLQLPIPLVLLVTATTWLVIASVLQSDLLTKQHHDPLEIVLDEVAGTCIALCMIPLTWHTLLLCFLLFRFFDICKPVGIRYLERLPGSWGIVADDVGAGLLTAFIVRHTGLF